MDNDRIVNVDTDRSDREVVCIEPLDEVVVGRQSLECSDTGALAGVELLNDHLRDEILDRLPLFARAVVLPIELVLDPDGLFTIRL